jgi:hypothetical protein
MVGPCIHAKVHLAMGAHLSPSVSEGLRRRWEIAPGGQNSNPSETESTQLLEIRSTKRTKLTGHALTPFPVSLGYQGNNGIADGTLDRIPRRP